MAGFLSWRVSRKKREGPALLGDDDPEVPFGHPQDPLRLQPRGWGDHRSARETQIEIAIFREKLPAAFKVGAGEGLQQECAVLKTLQEVELGLDVEEFAQEIVQLSEDRGGDDDGAPISFQHGTNPEMVLIVGVVQSVQSA